MSKDTNKKRSLGTASSWNPSMLPSKQAATATGNTSIHFMSQAAVPELQVDYDSETDVDEYQDDRDRTLALAAPGSENFNPNWGFGEISFDGYLHEVTRDGFESSDTQAPLAASALADSEPVFSLESANDGADGFDEEEEPEIQFANKEELAAKKKSLNEFIPTTLTFGEYRYTKKETKKGAAGVWTGYYRCSTWRSTLCKGTCQLKYDEITGGAINVRVPHSDNCSTNQNQRASINNPVVVGACIDISTEMHDLVVDRALSSISERADFVANAVLAHVNQKYAQQLTKKITINSMVQLVYVARKTANASWDSLIQEDDLARLGDGDARYFFRFNVVWTRLENKQRLIGWAHPNLTFRTKGVRVNLFIDCTFGIVPVGFSQLMIIMMYDVPTGIYIPLFFILLQSKDEIAYYTALQNVINACDWKLEAKSTNNDFEPGLINAIRDQFPPPPDDEPGAVASDYCWNYGCDFHWVQLGTRKMIKYSISKGEAFRMVTGPDALFKILSIVKVDTILTRAIPYIRAKFGELQEDVPKWDRYWSYFERVWLKGSYPSRLWNVYEYTHLELKKDILINRTNNPSESFNNKLKARFAGKRGRPSMAFFVEQIRAIAVEYAVLCNNIMLGNAVAPVHQRIAVYKLPNDY